MNYLSSLSSIFNNTTLKNGSLFTLYAFLNRGISFVLLIIIAKYIDPDGYGYVSMFSTVVTFLGYFICLGTTNYVSVSYFRNTEKEYKDTLRVVSDVTIICTLCFILLTFIFQSYLHSITGLSLKHLLFAIFISFSSVYTQTNLDIWRIEEKIGKYGLYSVGNAAWNFILTIVFVVSLKQDWEGRINAYFLLSIVFFFISVVFYLKRKFIISGNPSRKIYTDILLFSIPLIPHSITSWLRMGLDRIVINSYHSVELVGLFSFASNFSSIIVMIGNAFNATISVYIYKNLSTGGDSVRYKLKKQTIYIILGYIILTLLIMIGAYMCVPLIFPKYIGCLPYVTLWCLNALFQCVYYQFVNFLFYFKKTNILMSITLSVSLIHALLSFWLTRYSIFYTLWLEMLSSFAIMLFVYLYSRKVYRVL